MNPRRRGEKIELPESAVALGGRGATQAGQIGRGPGYPALGSHHGSTTAVAWWPPQIELVECDRPHESNWLFAAVAPTFPVV